MLSYKTLVRAARKLKSLCVFVSLCVISFVLSVQQGWAQSADPILVRNNLPFMEGLGLPAPKRSEINAPGQWSVTTLGSIQSFANVEANSSGSFTLDGEVHRFGVLIEWGFAPRWQASAIVEGVNNTAGSLDSIIDRWHDTFGLPDGDRPILGRDQLSFAVNNGLDITELSESSSGLADIELGLSYQWLSSERFNVAAHVTANVPAGDTTDLTGSQDLDVSASLAVSSKRSLGFNWHANLGLLAIGDDDVFGLATESLSWFSSAGVHWQPSVRWRWTAQFDGRGRLLETQFQELSDAAVQIAIGAEFSFASYAANQKRNSIQLYFTEDLSVNRAADFGLGLNVKFSL